MALLNATYPVALVYTALIALVVYYIAASIKSYWRLRKFKGPPLAAWSHLWYIRAMVSQRTHLCFSAVSTRYGPLARIAPNMLLTSDEEFFRRINTPRSGYRRSDWYKAFRFGDPFDNVLSETDNERHSGLRRRLGPGYFGIDTPTREADVDRVIFSLMASWRERFIPTHAKMDLGMQIQYLTLDIITVVSFGEPFGWVSTNSDIYEYIATVASNFPVVNFITAVPILSDIMAFPWVQKLLSPSIRDRVGSGKIKAESIRIIEKRYTELQARNTKGQIDATQDTTTPQDMTTSFINHNVTVAEIANGVLINMLAGSDTSATILRTGLLAIITNPRVLGAFRLESDASNVPLDQIISISRAQELPYLQACVKECMRFHPTTTGGLPRVVPPQGDYYEGQFIPGGTIIAQCGWNLHKLNFSAFGPDADIFRPERWIEAAATTTTKTTTKTAAQSENAAFVPDPDRMEHVHELVFGYGDFKCLGYKIALMEITKTMFELLRRFDFTIVDPMCPMTRSENYGIFLQSGLWVTVSERNP